MEADIAAGTARPIAEGRKVRFQAVRWADFGSSWPKAVSLLTGKRWLKPDIPVCANVLPTLEKPTGFPDRTEAVLKRANRRRGSVGKTIIFPTPILTGLTSYLSQQCRRGACEAPTDFGGACRKPGYGAQKGDYRPAFMLCSPRGVRSRWRASGSARVRSTRRQSRSPCAATAWPRSRRSCAAPYGTSGSRPPAASYDDRSPPWCSRCGFDATAPTRPHRETVHPGLGAALPTLSPQPIADSYLDHHG